MTPSNHLNNPGLPLAYRLFTPRSLFPDAMLSLGGNQAHYLSHVLRLGPSDNFHVFNGTDGEWQATILKTHKKGVEAHLGERLRASPSPAVQLFLFFAPLKIQRLEWLIEKATEIGVTHFVPCQTEHTSVRQANPQRLELIAVSATEQSGRLQPPAFLPLAPLQQQLEKWPVSPSFPLFFCDLGEENTLLDALQKLPPPSPSQIGLIIGPEGGWSPREREALKQNFPFLLPVSLGATILRAETAAILGLGMIALTQGERA